jgi:hypothetical protein
MKQPKRMSVSSGIRTFHLVLIPAGARGTKGWRGKKRAPGGASDMRGRSRTQTCPCDASQSKMLAPLVPGKL